jgi:phenylacetate-CoA ligase
VFRLPGLNSPRLYAMLGLPGLQPLLERQARRRAFDVYRVARQRCPAYSKFLAGQGSPAVRGPSEFSAVPQTDKANYVRAYSVEERCLDGRIPARGVVIDESSGSSGTPNNWVRGVDERRAVQRLLRHGLALTFRGQEIFMLNCFALGPWATGMNISLSVADTVILKSIGPDRQKLENTLRTFGPKYRYVVAGYPPFVKDFLSAATLDLSAFELHLVVGGEGMSEGLRDRFLRVFRTVHSSYGASDLEINIAAETPFTIATRRLCAADPALCRGLFGREDPPMLFQYNPLDYLVERSAEGELVFTLLRRGNIAPKVRYNIRDIGGAITHRELMRALGERGKALPNGLAFPVLFVYGRSDLTVPFYGAKVFAADVEGVLNGNPALRDAFHSFEMRTEQDAAMREILVVVLERARGAAEARDDRLDLTFYEGLARVNQDFREVARMFGPDQVRVEQHGFGEGPFAGRDIRVKHAYVRPRAQG